LKPLERGVTKRDRKNGTEPPAWYFYLVSDRGSWWMLGALGSGFAVWEFSFAEREIYRKGNSLDGEIKLCGAENGEG